MPKRDGDSAEIRRGNQLARVRLPNGRLAQTATRRDVSAERPSGGTGHAGLRFT